MDTDKKKCKNCQSEIDTKAKKCPHCQSDLRNWFARHIILSGILGLIVLIIVISASGSGGKKSDEQTTSTETKTATSQSPTTTADKKTAASPSPASLAKIGEAVTDGDLSFTVLGVKTANTLGSYYSKTAQGMFYIVTVQVKNNAKDTKTIDSSQFQVTDNQGHTFDRSSDGQTALGFQQGHVDLFLQQVQPSLSVTGDIVFDVPKDATGLKLVVKSGLFSSGKQIDLGK